MTVTITETVAHHVKSQAEKTGNAPRIRLGVRTSGCSGFMYTVDYAAEVQEADTVHEQHGIQVVVSRKSRPFLEGTEVDFIREGINQRLAFRNPNVKDECGCGESFTV